MKMYMIGDPYHPIVDHNIESWGKILPLLEKSVVVDQGTLIRAVHGHRFNSGRDFVEYLIKRKYLRLSPFARGK